MASSLKVKSGTEQQVELWIELKEQVDLVYKQLNQYRGACRSVDRLNRAVRRTGGQLDPDRMLAEFVKFERDYRVSRKRLRKLDRQLLAVNLYDKLYDLYESLVMGESIGTGGDLIDSSAIDKAIVVGCNGQVGTEDTSVDDFASISIDHDTHIDVEMDLMEDACLEPRQSETLNHSPNKSSTDLSQSSSILVADVSGSTRVTRQQTRRMSTVGSVIRKMNKDQGNIDSSAVVVDCNGPVGTEDTSLDDFVCISIDHDTPIDVEMDLMEDACLEPRQSATLNHSLNESSTDLSQSSSILVADVSGSTRVTRRQTRQMACIDSSSKVVGCNVPVGIEDNSVDGIADTERHFQCSQRDKSFKTSSDLRNHKKIHESEPRFKCSWEGCDYGANRIINLKVHQTVHSDKRPFQCPQCDKTFKASCALSIHKRSHETEPRFKCKWEGCDYGTYYSHALKAHQTVHTGKHRFRCSWVGCDYGTNRNSILKDHQSVHSDERPFQCPQCDKSFKTSSHLIHHKRTHESEPQYKCSWEGCGYETHYNSIFKAHQSTHSDERPFQCPQCDKSFKYSTGLSKHKNIHESEKRFKCSWEGCDFGTHRNDKLKVHQTVHSDERPFQCPHCDKSFKTSSQLSSHKRTHESEPRFKCKWEGCDYASHQLVNLTKHQNRHMANQN